MRRPVFFRPSRPRPDMLPGDPFPVHAPPVLQASQPGAASWLQYALPAVGSLGSLAFVIIYHNLLILIVSGAVALLSIGGGVGINLQRKSALKKRTKVERERYVRRLNDQREYLAKLAAYQRQVLTRQYPPVSEIASLVAKQERLWERRPEDQDNHDFLHVRLGIGAAPLCSPLTLNLTAYEDEYDARLLLMAHALVSEYHYVPDCPVILPLSTAGVVTISGNRAAARALTRSMLCQIAGFHAPDDVRVMALFQPDAASEWGWLKWLPHTRLLHPVKTNEAGAQEEISRLLADNEEDGLALLEQQIKPELEQRRKLQGNSRQPTEQARQAHLVIVIDGFSPESALAQAPVLSTLFKDAPALGVTIFCLVEKNTDKPSTIHGQIEINPGGEWLRFEDTSPGGRRLEGVRTDAADTRIAERISRLVAPFSLGDVGGPRDLSQDIRLLELLNIRSIDDLSVMETWKPRAAEDVLRVPIGMGVDGKPLLLDFKDGPSKGMGPHGLVVGATGSGKSELLKTIVTSLAITHSPSLLNFVLVDFKGGASFAEFGNLPHVAGMMTNLEGDASLVDRMYESLQGEFERRQQMLSQAGNLAHIALYHAQRQRDPTMQPMPYLLIIVDEFAELMAENPNFRDLFVRIGRIGRSIGMHLLLSTQRISEGHLENLGGHLRYRICLSTFSAADSSAALGTPDAFYLPSFPGMGYFQVDTSIYQMFKSAIISLPYVPPDEQKQAIIPMRKFTDTGKLVPLQLDENTPLPNVTPRTLDSEMNRVIGQLANSHTIQSQQPIRQVCLPPLEPTLSLTNVLYRCNLRALDGSSWPNPPATDPMSIPIGLLDRPHEQEQVPFFLDLSGGEGHIAIVGALQSGKSTLLRTIITSFLVTHAPNTVQFYVVDLGGGLLHMLESAPHVGAVCGRNESDKTTRLVRQMSTIIEERARLFTERGVDSIAAYRERRRAGEFADYPFGDVFLVIDDLPQFRNTYPQLEAELAAIISTGLAYGVHVIVTARGWNGIPSKIQDGFGQRLELHLSDPGDSKVSKAAARRLAAGIQGRGITKEGLLFQTALPLILTESSSSPDVQQSLESTVARSRAAWKGKPAPPIRILPAKVTLEEMLIPGTEPAGVPIGLEEFQLDPFYLDLTNTGPHFIIFGDSECGKTTLLRTWMRGLEKRFTPQEARFAIVDYRTSFPEFDKRPHVLTYAYNTDMVKGCVKSFKDILDQRKPPSNTDPFQGLQNKKTWDGPDLFLFVDEYDSLLAESVHPLNGLIDYLQQSRNLGFHLIIARRGGAVRVGDNVIARLRVMNSPSLVMNGEPPDGSGLHPLKTSALPPGRGYLVRRNQRPLLIQVAFSEPGMLNGAG